MSRRPGAHVGVAEDVLDVDHAALAARGVDAGDAGDREELLETLAGAAVVGAEMQPAVLADQEHALLVAREQALAALQDLLEHRPAVGDRAADHAQHLGGRGLLLERLLGLVEEARVLDRDHRLVGEGLEQGDLARQERAAPRRATTTIAPMPRSSSSKGANENRLPSPLASIAATNPGGNIGIVDVGVVHDPTLGHRERRRALRTGRERRASQRTLRDRAPRRPRGGSIHRHRGG